MFEVAVSLDPRFHVAIGTNQFNFFVNADFTTEALIGISLTEIRRKITAGYYGQSFIRVVRNRFGLKR